METKKTTKRAPWPVLGSIRKSEDGRNYLKLNDNVTILVDGKEIELNKSRTANLVAPADEVERMYKAGIISEDKIEERRSKVAATSAWLRYEIVAPPPKDT